MKFQSVEWSRNVARIHSQLKPSAVTHQHYILPDLPGTDLNEEAFFDVDLMSSNCNNSNQINNQINSNNYNRKKGSRIVTIAAGRHHTLESFDQTLRKYHQLGADKFLIVGGNSKGGLSTLDAISRAKYLCSASKEINTAAITYGSSTADIWCVANPNNKDSVHGVKDKLLAGADGIVTQPLLTSYAADVLDAYPAHYTSSTITTTTTTTITKLAGVALPKTERGLLFWLQLLNQSPNNAADIEHDELFQASLKHFQSKKSPLDWVQSQIAMYPEEALDGLHYMPMSNTDLLLDLLAAGQRSDTYP